MFLRWDPNGEKWPFQPSFTNLSESLMNQGLTMKVKSYLSKCPVRECHLHVFRLGPYGEI